MKPCSCCSFFFIHFNLSKILQFLYYMFSFPSSSFLSRIPLYGEFTCQNALMAEHFIEASSQYVSKAYLVLWDTTLN